MPASMLVFFLFIQLSDPNLYIGVRDLQKYNLLLNILECLSLSHVQQRPNSKLLGKQYDRP